MGNNTGIYNDISDSCCVDEVGQMVQKLVHIFQMFERDHIKIHGFTTSQCYTLLEIHKWERLAMNDISAKMNLSISTMTRILDNLVRDKFVLRSRDEADRRIVIISLTPRGRQMAEKLNNAVTQYYKRIIENIPSVQLKDTLKSVNNLLNIFEKVNPR